MTTPLLDPCHCFALRRAARAVSREYAEIMGETGLKHTQFSLLAILAEGGQHSISDLADIVGLERTSLSRTLRPLQNEGLVDVASEGYRRKREVSITAVGKARFEAGLPLWRKAQARFAEKMGTENIQSLRSLLAISGEQTGA